MSDVAIKFTGDSSQLRSELKKVEKNLNGVAGAVQGTTNKTKKGLDGLSDSVGDTGKSLDGLKDSAGETASVMGGLATSLSVVSPEAGAAVRVLGDLATGVEAASRGGSRLFAILGPVGVAVAALGAAYVAIKDDLDAANDALDVQRDRLESVAGMASKVKEAVLIAAHAELQAAQATGKATQAQVDSAAAALDEMAIAQKATDLFSARREALTKERDAIEEKIKALKESEAEEAKAADTARVFSSVTAAGAVGGAAFAASQRTIKAETKGNNAELKRLEQQLKLADTRVDTLNQTQDRYTEALKSTKESQKALTKSTKAGKEEEEKKAEAIKDTTAVLSALQSKNEAALVSQLNERQKILHSYQREVEAIKDLAAVHENDNEVQKAADEASHNRRIEAMRELDVLDAENAQKKQERADRERDQHIQNTQSMLSASSSLFGSIATLHGLSAENMSKTDKQAALKSFRTQKGLSMAAATMSWGEAMIAAWKRGNVAEAVLVSGAASAAYAASMAQINAQKPSFHSGTGLVRAPSGVSEMNATLRGGEAVSTPLGAEILGRGNIERANAGISSSNAGSVAFQYEHRVFSRFIRDNVRTRGPLGAEQDRKIRVGHRR